MASTSSDRWLVVGLANPESDYGGTRHNVGADAVRLLAARHNTDLDRNKRVRCEIGQIRVGSVPVVLAVPWSHMNTSGGPVQRAAAWFKVPPEQLVVVHDEIDLPLDAVRIKHGGGTAGHNGLRDVERALGTSDFLRVRIGVGRPPGRMAPKDYVLRRFSPAERESIDVTLEEVADAIESLVTDGLEPTQNRYHARRDPDA